MNRSLITVGSASAFAAVCLFAFVPGCGKPAGLPTDEPGKSGRKVEPWENVSNRLRKENDIAACKTALGQLNNELAERTDLPGVPALTPEAAIALQALVPLSTDDLAEIRGASYSSLDPAYLVECFYLRDAAHSLDLTGLTPLELARLGFDWVCRQMYVLPWVVDHIGYIPSVPPSYALRRGSGSGLERAFVFLALLQQMGIDACLIGSPEKPTLAFEKGKSAVHRGPFWAVGVRNGAEIALFDPWGGEPFPGPDGKGIATLAQVKANPSAWKLPPDEVKNARVVLAVPLSALSPRMKVLEDKIRDDTGVRLAIDAAALKARFAAPPPTGPGVETAFWNPPGDRFTYTRLLIAFLPTEEGGLDRAEPDLRPHTLYVRSLLPRTLIVAPPALKPQPAERLTMSILSVYASSFFVPPSPRERIQRGQFQDAARDLTEKLEAFRGGLDRLRSLNPATVDLWCEQANAVYDYLNLQRYPNPGQTVPQPDSDPAVVQAKAAIDEFWRGRESVARVLVDQATAGVGRSEAAYLLALAKHEEAERKQARGEKEPAIMAWREAANSWGSFLEQDGATSQPNRSAHAKTLAARANRLAESK